VPLLRPWGLGRRLPPPLCDECIVASSRCSHSLIWQRLSALALLSFYLPWGWLRPPLRDATPSTLPPHFLLENLGQAIRRSVFRTATNNRIRALGGGRGPLLTLLYKGCSRRENGDSSSMHSTQVHDLPIPDICPRAHARTRPPLLLK
jgi:hypothetical protein